MEIASLGTINSLVQSSGGKAATGGKSSNGFSMVFANMMAGSTQSSDSQQANEQANELTGEELAGLVQFLQIKDILDLDNGSDLLGKTMLQSDNDVVSLIQEQLNMSGEELLQLLTKLYNQLTSADENIPAENLLSKAEGESSEENVNDVIISLLQAISSLQIQNVNLVPDKEFGQGMKAVKLFDLIAAQQDSFGNETRLKDLIKSINDKLELKLNAQAPVAREEYLQKTFNNLVQEMNSKNSVLSGTEVSAENMTKVLTKTDSVHPGFLQFQQLSKPEQLTLMTNAQRPVSAEQLIEQFESILSRSKFMNTGGTQRLFIKLNPEHLGALRVELIQKDSMIIARILTSTSVAKDMMESQLNGLKHAFSSQNIQIERVEISQQFTGQERTFNREQQQQQERQQPREEQKEQHSNGDFTNSFEEALLNTEA
ncbi:flagellar hook-length control protein FliK [Cytobacillus praedii]|uniref:Flagellar hook-length control protein FliK n=1 Tax=Cytobacillus praedii TaxID=1742358 RepID=A0A4R1AZ94_9BACI|nr:flagellar hook-length control protein FliK [Cytobacillus praedii]TCJ05985.1 flagellar hook-length control protein FliK [Cytobacillus praedii]